MKITENVWKNWGFLKTDHGRLCTPDLVYFFFELVSYSSQRESIKYMNPGRISWLKSPIQSFEFPAILPWLPMMQLWAQAPLFAACTAVYKVSRAIAKRKEHFLSSFKSLVDSKIKWCCALSDRGHRVYLCEDNVSKQRKRYCFRAIFVWPWNENARIKQKQQTNGNRAIWLVYRTDTNARGFSGWKNVTPENFLEINRYIAWTSYCKTIGQSNNAFAILEFCLAGKQRGHVLIFLYIGW